MNRIVNRLVMALALLGVLAGCGMKFEHPPEYYQSPDLKFPGPTGGGT